MLQGGQNALVKIYESIEFSMRISVVSLSFFLFQMAKGITRLANRNQMQGAVLRGLIQAAWTARAL
jgi:hypothetical protein